MGMNPNSGLSEDYLGGLQHELLTATVAYRTFARAASKAGIELGLAEAYHNDLKGYCRQVSATYIMISDAYNYVETLITHAQNVSRNLTLSQESLTIIIRFLKCLCVEAEDLRISVRALIDAVEGIGDPALNPDVATLPKCLRELETEVTTTITAICTAISAMIDLLRGLMVLNHRIGSDEDGVSTGLINDLRQISAVLCCEYSAGISAALPPCPGDDTTTGAEAELADCCPGDGEVDERECELAKPAICDGGFGSTFFRERITAALEKARLLVEQKKCVSRFYARKSAGARSKMEAITKSLTAAQAAKDLCK